MRPTVVVHLQVLRFMFECFWETKNGNKEWILYRKTWVIVGTRKPPKCDVKLHLTSWVGSRFGANCLWSYWYEADKNEKWLNTLTTVNSTPRDISVSIAIWMTLLLKNFQGKLVARTLGKSLCNGNRYIWLHLQWSNKLLCTVIANYTGTMLHKWILLNISAGIYFFALPSWNMR